MSKVTVNVLVEIDGKTYKASNGMNVTGEVFEGDILNLINFGAKQIIAESGSRSISDMEKVKIEYAKKRIVADGEIQAQDANETD